MAGAAVLATNRKCLIVAALLAEACMAFPVSRPQGKGLKSLCLGRMRWTNFGALRRIEAAWALITSWLLGLVGHRCRKNG